jgi:hypothetical protein
VFIIKLPPFKREGGFGRKCGAFGLGILMAQMLEFLEEIEIMKQLKFN